MWYIQRRAPEGFYQHWDPEPEWHSIRADFRPFKGTKFCLTRRNHASSWKVRHRIVSVFVIRQIGSVDNVRRHLARSRQSRQAQQSRLKKQQWKSFEYYTGLRPCSKQPADEPWHQRCHRGQKLWTQKEYFPFRKLLHRARLASSFTKIALWCLPHQK